MGITTILDLKAGRFGNRAELTAPFWVINALTIDVEEYFQVSAFSKKIPPDQWDALPSRVVEPTERILEILAARGIRATFFIVGWVAKRHAGLIRRIHAMGHQIGSHSMKHRIIYHLTPAEFRADLRHSCALLEDIVGDRVTSFRAPSFSITPRSLWALEILVEEGIVFDSSIFPIYHDRYGLPHAPRWPFQVSTKAGDLWEFPATTVRCLGLNLPIGGGGYFRLYPFWLTRYLFAHCNRWGYPLLLYLHPWEFDPNQPRLQVAPATRFRHYINLRKTENKFKKIVDAFRWTSIDDAVASWALINKQHQVIKLSLLS